MPYDAASLDDHSSVQSPRHPYALSATPVELQPDINVRLGVDELLDSRPESIPASANAYLVGMKVSYIGTLPFLQIKLVKTAEGCDFVTSSIEGGSVVDCPPGEYQGMLWDQNEPYLFYLEEEEDQEVVPRIRMKNNQHQWAAIAEILNQRRVYDSPVFPSVVRFFERNPQVCFIMDDNLAAIETPAVVYNGAYSGGITCAINLGKARAGPYAKYGAFYYFGDYALALRYACFTVNMEPRLVMNKKITRGTSAVLEHGGIAKYALREGIAQLVEPESTISDAWAEDT